MTTMDSIDTWLWALAGGAVYALAWALVWCIPAILMRRNDLADVAWGLVFPYLVLLVGGAVVVFDWRDEPRATVAIVLVSAWALRLSLHIFRRWLAHDEEDRRYARWREQWGGRWMLRSVLQVFVLQALIALVVAQPLFVVVVQTGDVELGVLDVIAIAFVLVGLWLESTADRQLRRFLRRRKAGEEQSRYLTTGVWSWSRHPNYAGDAITWWGFGLFGLAAVVEMGDWLLLVPVVVGPAVMTWFLRYGSGVPLAERGRAGNPEWDAYVERTSAFLPRPPRRSS